jgi:hypothetical protein
MAISRLSKSSDTNILNYIIILILVILVYFILRKKQNTNKSQQNTNKSQQNTNKSNKYKKNISSKNLDKDDGYKYLDDIFDEMSKSKGMPNLIYKTKRDHKTGKYSPINPFFLDIRIHNDYRDVLTSFDNVAPDQRPYFNRSMLPVRQVQVDPVSVKPMVKEFIKRINEDVKVNVYEQVTSQTGWNEYAELKKPEIDGWGKQMRQLGLPESLWDHPAHKDKLRLLKIDEVEKFITEEQINIIVHMVIQKKNVSDQMVIRVSYIMDNVDINADRNFNKDNVAPDYNVRIEEIYVIGYLTDYRYGDTNTNRKDFYEFTDIEKGNMLDQDLILKTLKDKYKQLQVESDGFNISIPLSQSNDTAIFRLGSQQPYNAVGGDGCF